MRKIIKGMIVVGVMVFAMLAFAGCGKKEIHLNDYFTYSVEGYDGMGKAIASFDSNAFESAVLAEYKEMDFWTLEVLLYDSQCGHGAWSKETGLSNGDKIVYQWQLDRKMLAENKMNITADDIEVTVSGLEEITTYDPFQDAVITFSGADGYGVVEYDTTKCKVPVTFTSTKEEKLSNGDTVTISYSKSQDIPGTIAQYGAALIGGSKEFTVEGLEALKEFDPFENLVITYTGTSPLATMVFDTKAVPVPDLYYYCENNDHLANGDTTEIKVRTNNGETLEEQCALNGFIPTREKKSIEVAGADEWLQKVSDIPEAVAKRIDKVAEDYMVSKYAQELESYKGMERVGFAVCNRKKHENLILQAHNVVYYVFKVTVVTESGQESSYYSFLEYFDVNKLGDGTVVLDEDDYNYCTHSFTLPDFGSVYGYSSLDAFFADNVLSIAENFTYDTNLEVG